MRQYILVPKIRAEFKLNNVCCTEEPIIDSYSLKRGLDVDMAI